MSLSYVLCSKGLNLRVKGEARQRQMLGGNILSRFLQELDKTYLGWAWESGSGSGRMQSGGSDNYEGPETGLWR